MYIYKSEICGEVDFSCTNIGYFINSVFALYVYEFLYGIFQRTSIEQYLKKLWNHFFFSIDFFPLSTFNFKLFHSYFYYIVNFNITSLKNYLN